MSVVKTDIDGGTETSWWGDFLDTVKETAGGWLNYDLTKKQIEAGSNNNNTNNSGQYDNNITPSTNNQTMLIVGGLVFIALLFVVMKK